MPKDLQCITYGLLDSSWRFIIQRSVELKIYSLWNCRVTYASTTLGKRTTGCTVTLYNTFIIIILYIFRATVCSSSGGQNCINLLTPNDPYMGRTAPLTSKRCILYIYSTNIGTEYFKHALYSPFYTLQNAVCFIMLTCLVPYYSHFIYRMC